LCGSPASRSSVAIAAASPGRAVSIVTPDSVFTPQI
jgi:hypothetical protein